MTLRINSQQRRARLATRHLLAGPAPAARTAEDVAEALVALHATDAATVHLAVAARLADPRIAATEDALYDRRTLLRMLGMRRTMFVVPTAEVPVIQAACTDAIAVDQRKRIAKDLVQCGAGDAAWLDEVGEATYAALHRRGGATAAQLAVDEPRLRTEMVFPDAKQYLTSRLLLLLAAQGRIVRGRPLGSWISSQYQWSTVDAWLPDGLPAAGAPDADTARTRLAGQWLARYGPGTVADLKWWTGWTMGHAKKALAALDTVEVDLDGVSGVVLADDVEPVAEPGPWVALLPALDPTVMGWAGRDWYLGGHGSALFDRTGNPGPTVWADGRIVGGWAQRADGGIAVELLEKVDAATRAAIDTAADELHAWLGPIRVTPRFRTPLERGLST